MSLTAPSLDEAARLGRSAVENRLAACAQVFGPIASTYWWEGEVRSAEEWSCQLKTTRALLRRLTESLRASHSYDVPEIVAVPIDDGDPAYHGWIEGETRSDP